MRCVIETLTFDLADDIALALENGSITTADLPRCKAIDLAPAFELLQARPEIAASLRQPVPWLEAEPVMQVLDAIVENQQGYTIIDGRYGVISVTEIQRSQSSWIDFAIKLKAAVVEAGFSPDHAGKLLAAVGEFFNNVIEHSVRVESGHVIFSAGRGRFEFIVRDSGIGVLDSLRTNPNHAQLEDAGSAIELALQEGVSRHANGSARGFGFRPVFIGLVNISEHMRFRSGDHCREYVRQNDGSTEAHTKQCAALAGFHCTGICTPESV